MASYPTHQDPEYIRIWKTDTPVYMTSNLIITPRTLLPWLLARFQCVNTGGTKSQVQPFFLLFGRVWEQDDKQWKTGNEVTWPVGPTYSHCLLPVFLQLQCHVMSCDIMWYHCDVMWWHDIIVMSCDIIEVMWWHVMSCDYNVMSWWQCAQFAKSLWPKSSSVECLPSGEIPLFSWPWNAGRKETQTPEPDNRHHRYHFFLHSPIPLSSSPDNPSLVWGI